jgi:hypothetical protein
MEGLPPELVLLVASWLPLMARVRLARTCRWLRACLAHDPALVLARTHSRQELLRCPEDACAVWAAQRCRIPEDTSARRALLFLRNGAMDSNMALRIVIQRGSLAQIAAAAPWAPPNAAAVMRALHEPAVAGEAMVLALTVLGLALRVVLVRRLHRVAGNGWVCPDLRLEAVGDMIHVVWRWNGEVQRFSIHK